MKPEMLNIFSRFKGATAESARRRYYPSMRVRTSDVPAGTSFARNKSLEVRLARNPFEIRYAQHLRYQVFYEEMSAIPSAATRITHRDEDSFDKICDHLMVLDHEVDNDGKVRRRWRRTPRVVGTYRLLRQDMAEAYGGFYTPNEFGIAPVLARQETGPKILAPGRSRCISPVQKKANLDAVRPGRRT